MKGIHIRVLGVIREDTTNSNCGSTVTFFTEFGDLTLDDRDMYFSPSLFEKVKIALGLETQTMTGSTVRSLASRGRRLGQIMPSGKIRLLQATAVALQGLFEFLESYDWTCTSINKPMAGLGLANPTDPSKGSAYTLRVETPCDDQYSCTSDVPGMSQADRPGVPPVTLDTPAVYGGGRDDYMTRKVYHQEWVIQMNKDEWIQTGEWPNHPGQILYDVAYNATHMMRFQYAGIYNLARDDKSADVNAKDNHVYYCHYKLLKDMSGGWAAAADTIEAMSVEEQNDLYYKSVLFFRL